MCAMGTEVAGGDFRQTLPVVPDGYREQIISKSSSLQPLEGSPLCLEGISDRHSLWLHMDPGNRLSLQLLVTQTFGET
jgi:hypothetical protein